MRAKIRAGREASASKNAGGCCEGEYTWTGVLTNSIQGQLSNAECDELNTMQWRQRVRRARRKVKAEQRGRSICYIRVFHLFRNWSRVGVGKNATWSCIRNFLMAIRKLVLGIGRPFFHRPTVDRLLSSNTAWAIISIFLSPQNSYVLQTFGEPSQTPSPASYQMPRPQTPSSGSQRACRRTPYPPSSSQPAPGQTFSQTPRQGSQSRRLTATPAPDMPDASQGKTSTPNWDNDGPEGFTSYDYLLAWLEKPGHVEKWRNGARGTSRMRIAKECSADLQRAGCPTFRTDTACHRKV